MERKKQIIRLTNYTQSALHAFLDSLSDEEKNKSGLVDHWAVKDHYAHMVYWMEHFADRLIKRNTEKEKITDIDKENARIFERTKGKSLADTVKALDAVYEKMGHQIRILSESELMSIDIVPSLTDRPLWQAVLSDTTIHPISHLTCMYFERGNDEKAMEVHKSIVEDLLSLDDSARWQAVTIYNLGCTYSLGGNKEKAIELLAQALKINPDLKEWSQHDPDFENIRGEAGYQALYT